MALRRLEFNIAPRIFRLWQSLYFATVCIVLSLYPLPVASQETFSISADVDGTAGDQRVTTAEVSPEAAVSIQIFGNNLSQSQGVSVRFVYDSGQVVYEGTDAGDVYPNTQVLVETGANPTSVTLGIASLGDRAATSAGLVGTARFRTKAAFTGTTIRIVEAVLGGGGRQDTLTLNFAIELSRASAGPSPDFDADGTVGFSDFLQFAAQYGTSEGDGRYDVQFDLDSDGSVGFADFLVLAGQFGQEVAQQPPEMPDRNALVALYNATEGYNWTIQINWLTDNPIDTWHGVSAAGGQVTGLVLSQNNLTGEIPAELGELASLDSLKLDRNALGGEIPPELGDLSSLTKLELYNNKLSGGIPIELGSLHNLSWLVLAGNPLGGSIPEELSRLKRLEVLALTRNQLTGEVPAWLGDLSNLTSLWLNGNQLNGHIPVELGNLNRLWALSLAGNELTGPIPAELGNLTALFQLWLSFNKLSGSIPAELGKLDNLVRLSLAENQLSGALPSALGNLAKLELLSVEENRLSGPIPPEFGNLPKLKYLRVDNNGSLTGALPNSLTGLAELVQFYFDGTGLCAPVDEGFQTWFSGIEDTRGANCE